MPIIFLCFTSQYVRPTPNICYSQWHFNQCCTYPKKRMRSDSYFCTKSGQTGAGCQLCSQVTPQSSHGRIWAASDDAEGLRLMISTVELVCIQQELPAMLKVHHQCCMQGVKQRCCHGVGRLAAGCVACIRGAADQICCLGKAVMRLCIACFLSVPVNEVDCCFVSTKLLLRSLLQCSLSNKSVD